MLGLTDYSQSALLVRAGMALNGCNGVLHHRGRSGLWTEYWLHARSDAPGQWLVA